MDEKGGADLSSELSSPCYYCYGSPSNGQRRPVGRGYPSAHRVFTALPLLCCGGLPRCRKSNRQDGCSGPHRRPRWTGEAADVSWPGERKGKAAASEMARL